MTYLELINGMLEFPVYTSASSRYNVYRYTTTNQAEGKHVARFLPQRQPELVYDEVSMSFVTKE